MKSLLFILLFALIPTWCFAGGAVATGNDTTVFRGGDGIEVIQFVYTLTSDASGDVSYSVNRMVGRISEVCFEMDETATPTTAFDCTLDKDTSAHSVDYFGGAGADIASADDVCFVPYLDGVYKYKIIDDAPSIVCANMGNAKIATMTIYVEQ